MNWNEAGLYLWIDPAKEFAPPLEENHDKIYGYKSLEESFVFYTFEYLVRH